MAQESEGLLAYFQRLIVKLLSACTADNGISEVRDIDTASILMDSIERIFQQGRIEDQNNTWDVLKSGAESMLDLLLTTQVRFIERQIGLHASDKSKLFFQYAVLNKLLSNFVEALSKNNTIVSRYYDDNCIMNSTEHVSMFTLQLKTLELLNFSKVWDAQHLHTQEPSNSKLITHVHLPSSSSGASSEKFSTKSESVTYNSDRSKPPASARADLQRSKPGDGASLLFGPSSDVPVTFSLKSKPIDTQSSPYSHHYASLDLYAPAESNEAPSPYASISTFAAAGVIEDPPIKPVPDISNYNLAINQDIIAVTNSFSPTNIEKLIANNDETRTESSDAPAAAISIEPSTPGSHQKRVKKRMVEL